MQLTDTAIRNAKPAPKAVKMFDAGGLFLLVQPTGSKLWRLKYRFASSGTPRPTPIPESLRPDSGMAKGAGDPHEGAAEHDRE